MQPVHLLYDGLLKHEATALFLLRTEVLGLNAWLASVGVPGIDKRCSCGWPAQTVRHILLFCPNHADSRALYFQRAGLADFMALCPRRPALTRRPSGLPPATP
jgi:hypothetical protein